ncbi:type VII secretion protein EccB [Mycolicibacterium sp. XJ870]
MAEFDGPEKRRRHGFRLTARYQVSGWRFLYRRLQHALVRRDTRMIDDPQRFQASPLALGLILAVIVGVGALVWGLISPAGLVADAKIVADKDSGALYVRVGNRLDPVTNLTSARLIVGAPHNPVRARPSEIAKLPRGSLVGIVGAPVDIRDSNDPSSVWTVCDTTATGAAVPLDPVSGLPSSALSPVTTTVIGGPLDRDQNITAIEGAWARLVGYRSQTWLVYARPDGVVVRAAVDPTDAVVADALGLRTDHGVLPISQGLFNALPAEPPLIVPVIAEVGTVPRFASQRRLEVGTILKVAELNGESSYYVVLSDGVQQVGVTAATMIRAANRQAGTEPAEIGPDELADYPKSRQLSVDYYPAAAVHLVPPTHSPVTCWSWSHDRDDPTASTEVLTGRSLPLTPQRQDAMVPLVTAPYSDGATADRTSMPTTTGRFVQVTGAAPDSRNRGSYFWLSDNGVRFGLDSAGANGEKTLSSLGLHNPVRAPWVVVSLFAIGPTLSQRDALIRHDGVPPDQLVAGIDPEAVR